MFWKFENLDWQWNEPDASQTESSDDHGRSGDKWDGGWQAEQGGMVAYRLTQSVH